MDCNRTCELLGAFCDGELPCGQADTVRDHLAGCTECRSELDKLQRLDQRLVAYEAATHVKAPPALWASIQTRLMSGEARPAPRQRLAWMRRPLAMAASVGLILAAGVLITFLSDKSTSSAQAAVIDYGVLMNGVAVDVRGAIQRFLDQYHAAPVDLRRAHVAAPGLSFDLPPELPGGYHFVQAYQLTFGQATGIAATYDRDGQPVFLIFHSVSQNTKGPGATSCMIGGLQGSQIEIGRWRLAHITDNTTCHCVLSTLEPGTELETMVRAIAPDLTSGVQQQTHCTVH